MRGASLIVDPLGRYAHPDVFSPHVDTAPQRAVTMGAAPEH